MEWREVRSRSNLRTKNKKSTWHTPHFATRKEDKRWERDATDTTRSASAGLGWDPLGVICPMLVIVALRSSAASRHGTIAPRVSAAHGSRCDLAIGNHADRSR